ncbi:MAG: 4Fe-4S dicluster domain-containing protein [Planctomycetes bacterium]|nr:4Fe-4S dicluster domain-containing protein [Planctomycetota bacterium]
MTAPTMIEQRDELLAFTNNGGCINCGTCTAVCPLPKENVMLPRHILRLMHLGQREELIARADAIFSCLLCRLCEETCPAGVSIPECVRYLRGFMNRHLHHLEKE